MRVRETINMTQSGEILSVRPAVPLAWKIGAAVIAAAFIAGAVAGALLLLWITSVILPVAIVLALAGVAVLRIRAWRVRRSLGRGSHLVPL